MPELADPPLLETARLRLCCPDARHLEPLAAMLADAELNRFLGGTPADLEATWRHLAFLIGHWRLRGHGPFAVEDRATGRFIGRVGLLDPEGWPGTELAWTIARADWGQGFAGEAARAVLAWAMGPLGLAEPPISLIDPLNRRSVRVAEKLGARPERRIAWHGQPVDVWRHRWP
jgi:RimJ/RimL family protein N-acetyltransferase